MKNILVQSMERTGVCSGKLKLHFVGGNLRTKVELHYCMEHWAQLLGSLGKGKLPELFKIVLEKKPLLLNIAEGAFINT